jgi:serine/threonine-protein kinase
MLTSEPPFMGEGVTDLCAKIIEQEPRPPSQLAHNMPPALDRIVLKCLEKVAAHRYPSVAELASDLLPFAHPRYHAQVDRIIRTLHSAGLTDLQLSSVPPPALAEAKRMLSLPAQNSVPSFASDAPGEHTASQSGVLTRASEASTLPAPGSSKLPWLLGGVTLLALIAIGTFVAYARLQSPAVAAPVTPAPAPVPAPTELQPVATAAAGPAETATTSAPPPVETSAHTAPTTGHRPPRAGGKPAPALPPTHTPAAPSVAPTPKPGLDIELSR